MTTKQIASRAHSDIPFDADPGPRMRGITSKSPFLEPYSTCLPLNETTTNHDPEALTLINSGRIWGESQMRRFGKRSWLDAPYQALKTICE